MFWKKEKEIDLCFEKFTASEMVRLGILYENNSRVFRKLESVIMTKIIKEDAMSPEEIKYARKILPMMFDTMEGFSNLDRRKYDVSESYEGTEVSLEKARAKGVFNT
jgi:hypothetical protein